MSSNNEHTTIVIKKNCLKCKVYFMNLLKCIKCCYPLPKSKDEDSDDINYQIPILIKRTPSMNDYVVNSYINNKTDDKMNLMELEVPNQKIVRV